MLYDTKGRKITSDEAVTVPDNIKASPDLVAHCNEVDELGLYLTIRAIGQMICRMEKMYREAPPEQREMMVKFEQDLITATKSMSYAVAMTTRFGVEEPFITGTRMPSSDYTKWYSWWDNYVEEFDEAEWEKIQKDIEDGKDTSNIRPTGDWRGLVKNWKLMAFRLIDTIKEMNKMNEIKALCLDVVGAGPDEVEYLTDEYVKWVEAGRPTE